MSLYAKIHAVMCESESLEKNLTVGSGSNSYKAVGEAEVLNAIKPLFKKHGLIILPVSGTIAEMNSTVETEYNGVKKTTARNIAQLTCYFKIIDIETGEFEQIIGFGFGADSQDKGSGKAFTYALKTALQKSFLLFSGEDTDNDHSDDIGKAKPLPAKAPNLPQTKPLTQPNTIGNSPLKTSTQGKLDSAEVKSASAEPITEGTKYICEACTLQISDVKAKDGKIYPAAEIAASTKKTFGHQLCWDCSVKIKNAAKAAKSKAAEAK